MSTCSMAFVDNMFADQMGIPEATFSNPFSTWAIIILDCMEVQVQQPAHLLGQSQICKCRNTSKLLVGISPFWLITFLSPLWGGSVSDREIGQQSQFCTGNLLDKGDSVMADCGFNIDDLLAPKGETLSIPLFLDGQPQLTRKEVEKTWRIVELRIHVERANGWARHYKILNSPIPLNTASVADDIVSVCFWSTNFDKPLVVYNIVQCHTMFVGCNCLKTLNYCTYTVCLVGSLCIYSILYIATVHV